MQQIVDVRANLFLDMFMKKQVVKSQLKDCGYQVLQILKKDLEKEFAEYIEKNLAKYATEYVVYNFLGLKDKNLEKNVLSELYDFNRVSRSFDNIENIEKHIKAVQKISENAINSIRNELSKKFEIKNTNSINNANNTNTVKEKTEKTQTQQDISKKRSFSKEEIEKAANTNIIYFLESKGYSFKRVGVNRYAMRGHDSLAFFADKNDWHSFKDNMGGNLINFLQYYENKTFIEAVSEILGKSIDETVSKKHKIVPEEEKIEKGELILPLKNSTNKHAYAYLTKERLIDEEIVNSLIKNSTIYENDKKSVVFLSKDIENNTKSVFVRSTNTEKKFRQFAKNSDRDYGFSIKGKNNTLFIFESAIDLLSHATMSKMLGKDWQADNRLSLNGTYEKAFDKFLEENKNIDKVILFLNNDKAGLEVGRKIVAKHENNYNIRTFISKENGKDINDVLKDYKTSLEKKSENSDISIKNFFSEIKFKISVKEKLENNNNLSNQKQQKQQNTLSL